MNKPLSKSSIISVTLMIVMLAIVTLTASYGIVKNGLNPISPTTPSSKPKAGEDPFANITPALECRLNGGVPTISPTPTPGEIIIQGRVYEDADAPSNPNETRYQVGRQGFQAAVPPCYKYITGTKVCDTDRGQIATVPYRIDINVTGGTEAYMTDIANWMTNNDSCSESSKQERGMLGAGGWSACGLSGGNGTHCSKYGGFSLRIPSNAEKYMINGAEHYLLRFVINDAIGGAIADPDQTNSWHVTEAYWMDTTPIRVPSPMPTLRYRDQDVSSSSYGLVCDWEYMVQNERTGNSVTCNQCLRRAENHTIMCDPTTGQMCKGTVGAGDANGFHPNEIAYLYVPVNGATLRNLWVGVRKYNKYW